MMTYEKRWLAILLAAILLTGPAVFGGERAGSGFAPEGTVIPNELPIAGENGGPATATWRTNAPIPVTNGLLQSTLVAAGDIVYSVGGGTGVRLLDPDARISQVYAYDPAENTYTQKADIPVDNGISAFGAAVELNGFIYVFGGITGVRETEAVLATTWVYSVADDAWTAGADLPEARFGSAVGVIGGKIYVAGGADATYEIRYQTWEYNPETASFTEKAPIPENLGPSPMYRIHAVSLEDAGEIHAFAGGFEGRNHLVYTPAADTWSNAPIIPNSVTDPGVAVWRTNIYVLGAAGVAGRTQVYNTTARTWSQGPAMPGQLNNTGAATVGDVIYVIGGFNGTGPVPVNYGLSLP